MKNHEFDKAVKEEFAEYRLTPKVESWEKVNSVITPHKTYWKMITVAAILVLGLSLSLIYKQKTTIQKFVNIENDFPKMPLEYAININLTINNEISEQVPTPPTKSQISDPMSGTFRETPIKHQWPIPLAKIDRREILDMEVEFIPSIMAIVNQEPVVTIRYYPSTRNKIKKLDQLIAKVSNFNPGEWIGELRSAKNEFFLAF